MALITVIAMLGDGVIILPTLFLTLQKSNNFRQYALNYAELNQKIEKLSSRLDDTDVKTNEIFELLKELLEHKKELEKPSNPIGFRTSANS